MSWLPDWITGYDSENAQRAADADRELQRLNLERYGVPYVNQDDYQGPQAARDSIDSAFVSGLEEGRQNVKGFFNGAVWQLLKSIPLVVWIGAAVALFIWMGGLSLLKGKFAKA